MKYKCKFNFHDDFGHVFSVSCTVEAENEMVAAAQSVGLCIGSDDVFIEYCTGQYLVTTDTDDYIIDKFDLKLCVIPVDVLVQEKGEWL